MRRGELNKHGKKYADWRKVRSAWVLKNPPNHEGYYLCGICGQSVHIDDMELDHINPRSGQPESIAEAVNLQPTHSRCNWSKGSRRLKPTVSPLEYQFRKELDL